MMLKVTSELLGEIKGQNQFWITVKESDWEFLFVEMTGQELIEQGINSQGKGQSSFLSGLVFNGIKNWKNVKLSDLMEIAEDSKHFQNKDQNVEFNKDLFDIFTGKHNYVIEDILKGIESHKIKEKLDIDNRKKK